VESEDEGDTRTEVELDGAGQGTGEEPDFNRTSSAAQADVSRVSGVGSRC